MNNNSDQEFVQRAKELILKMAPAQVDRTIAYIESLEQEKTLTSGNQ